MYQTSFLDSEDENTAEVSRLNKRRKSKSQARARRTDPKSSHLAAERFEASTTAAGQRGQVIDLVFTRPGKTSKELAEFCEGMDRHQVARRLPEAEKMGEIHSRGRDESRQITWWPGTEMEVKEL